MNENEKPSLNEKNWLVNIWIIRIIRLAILVLGWSSIIISLVLSENLGLMFSTYTMQSNIIVLIWLSIATFFSKKE